MSDQRPFANLALQTTSIDITDLLNEIAIRLAAIGASVAVLSPDTTGRLRINVETGTLTDQTRIGGHSGNINLPAITQMNELALRNNIGIS